MLSHAVDNFFRNAKEPSYLGWRYLKWQAVLLTGHWLDLWDHPEHQTCKILKGVRDLGDVGQRQQEQEQQQRASPTRNPTPAATSTTEENGGSATVQGLIPAKVMAQNHSLFTL